jgi:hypothetical protein
MARATRSKLIEEINTEVEPPLKETSLKRLTLHNNAKEKPRLY